jgi:hypothetical protein
MQSGHEQDIILILELVLVLAFQLPVGVVDQDKNPRPSVERFVSICLTHCDVPGPQKQS